ncbi:MAG TPA: O-antigen ligase family protein [Candidatus Polarisedimenticolaceae bacterium]
MDSREGGGRPIVLLLALLLAALPLTLATRAYDPFLLPQFALLVAGTGLLAGLTLWRMARGEAGPGLHWSDVAAIAWAVWACASVVWSGSPAVSLWGEYDHLDGALAQVTGVSLYLVARWNVRSREDVRVLLLGLTAGALVTAMIVACQSAGIDALARLSLFGSQGRFSAAMANPLAAGAAVAFVIPLAWGLALSGDARRVRREVAVLCGVGSAALVTWTVLSISRAAPPAELSLAAVGPFAFLIGGTASLLLARWGRDRGARGAWLFGVSALAVRALVDTGSRGALLGAAAAVAVGLTFRMARGGRLAPGVRAIGLAIVGALVLVVIAGRSAGGARLVDSASRPLAAIVDSRLDLWSAAASMWRERPLTGQGADMYMTRYAAHLATRRSKDSVDDRVGQSAHNEMLQVLATLGLVGAAIGLALLAGRAWPAIVAARAEGIDRAAAVAVLAAGAGYLVYLLLGIATPPLRGWWWALLGSASALGSDSTTQARAPVRRPLRAAWAIAAVLCPLAAAWVAGTWIGADVRHARAVEAAGRSARAATRDGGAAAHLPELMDELARLRLSSDAEIRSLAGHLESAGSTWLRTNPGGRPVTVGQDEFLHRVGEIGWLLVAVAREADAVGTRSGQPRYWRTLGDHQAALATVFLRSGEESPWMDRSVAAYRRATELNPAEGYAWAGEARLRWIRYEFLGVETEAEEALLAYRESLRVTPNARAVAADYLALCRIRDRSGDADVALAAVAAHDAQLAVRVRLDASRTLMRAAVARRLRGRVDEAAALRRVAGDYAAAAVRLAGKGPEASFALAMVDCDWGEVASCRTALEAILLADPGFEPARRVLESLPR